VNSPNAAFDNPFATRWVAPGALPFVFPSGSGVMLLVDALRKEDWRGAIVGPHGCGKSTLLATMVPLLGELAWDVEQVVLREGERVLPHRALDGKRGDAKRMVVVDGWEQLRPWTRRRVARRCRRAGWGLLVTCHMPTNIPSLLEIEPDLATAQAIVAKLTDGRKATVPFELLAASFHQHRGNLREVLFELYDWYERCQRNNRNDA